MSKFVLTIELDNAAFKDDPTELARVLRKVADTPDIASYMIGESSNVRDINGNTVGHWEKVS